MQISENVISQIVKEMIAKLPQGGVHLNSASLLTSQNHQNGIFPDMQTAISAAKESLRVVKHMPMDLREKIIANIRIKTRENAEILSQMAVEETGMGNVAHKILKHHLAADKTPGKKRSRPQRNDKYADYF